MLAILLSLLMKLTFFLFVYILESPRLTPFTLQLNQAALYLLSLVDHQSSKPTS
jgi:hypothetical protein